MKITPISIAIALCCSVPQSNIHASEQTINSAPEALIETITVLGASNAKNAKLGGINLKELPLNAHVVGQIEIERIRFVDPDELLDRIPGETQVRNLRIPNGGKSYTLAFVDGVPIESPYSGATQRLDRVNTADIQRVEVIKGPASALFPNNVFGGVVNVVTQDVPKQSSGSISAESGNFGRRRLGVDYGNTVGDFGYSLNLNSRKLDGLREESQNDRDAASVKLVYDLNDRTRLTSRAERFEEVTQVRGNLSAEQIATDPRQAGSLSSATDLIQDTASITVRHQLDQGEINGVLLRRTKDTIGLSRFRGPQDSNDDATNANLSYRHDLSNGSLIFGIDTYRGDVDTKQFDRADVDLAGDFNRFSTQLAIDAYYGQYKLDVTDRFTVIAGVRHEEIHLASDLEGGQQAEFDSTAPKLGLTYAVSDTNQVWLSVSEGFYTPDLDDLYDPENGNPNLKPEEAKNIELGIRGNIGNWAYDTSIYRNRISNYLVTQELFNTSGDEFELTTNAGQVTVQGVESVLEYAPSEANWRIGVTHTYAKNKFDSFVQSTPGAADDYSGNELARSPEHHLNARLAWEPLSNFTAELEGDFYSTYYSDDANSDAGKFKRDERLNLRLSYAKDQWRFWLNVLNLSDTLEDRSSFSRGNLTFRTVDGRNYYAGVSYQF
ncbi:TonB-dependent receptor [Arenicella sp. 4NH20-0111]|uniref:TonB-dependent receptor family protein n=1 Tax=Arenicella sp. 4NH20-0111 TaxID=3127648 RepID=UPI0031076B4D